MISACTGEQVNIKEYHALINQAELAICANNLKESSLIYQEAFNHIDKPFGKDLFNAALVQEELNNKEALSDYLQQLVNNLDDFDYLKPFFVDSKISNHEWQTLLQNREISFDPSFKNEVKEIFVRDQMYRPDYDNYDSLIYNNLITNLRWIIEKTISNNFPAHQELGYSYNLRGEGHLLVLHHAAQRRSYDKSMIDLEPILYEAVLSGRLDPEAAIQYMAYQNDKLDFKNVTVWQFHHSQLPDSLNSIYWISDVPYESNADSTRMKWLACTISDAEKKAQYLSENLSSEFIFTSVHKSEGYIDEKLNLEQALATYHSLTTEKKRFLVNASVFED